MQQLAPGVFCIAQFIDALELSVHLAQTARGGVHQPDELHCTLDALKRQAKERPPGVVPFRAFSGHPDSDVVVHARGIRDQPFRLECPRWVAGVRSDGSFGPRMFIQLRARYLHEVGAATAAAEAMAWVTEALAPLVGRVPEGVSPTFSIRRLDLAADVCGNDFVEEDRLWMTTRAASADLYSTVDAIPAVTHVRRRRFTGFRFGSRSSGIVGRIYDKTVEAPCADPVRGIWASAGYTASLGSVWRIEFELHSARLAELVPPGALTNILATLDGQLDPIWRYLTEKWLVFRDQTRPRSRIERTPVASWWAELSALDWRAQVATPDLPFGDQPPAPRSHDRLWATLAGCLASWGALNGEDDLGAVLDSVARECTARLGPDGFREKVAVAEVRRGISRRRH